MAVDDQVERDALGVALFGTMWEDLGTEAMEAMKPSASQAAYDTEGALEDQRGQVQRPGQRDPGDRPPDGGGPAAGGGRRVSIPYGQYVGITEAMEEVSPVILEINGDFADWAGGAISDGLPVLVDGIRDFANWAGKAYEKAKPFLSFLWEHGAGAGVASGPAGAGNCGHRRRDHGHERI